MLRTARTAILGALMGLVLLRSAYGESDFHFQMPPGWEDLADPVVRDGKAPRDMVQDARSGRFLIYAVDPESLARDRIPATMSATRSWKTFRMTDNNAQALAAALGRMYVNVTIDPSETKVIKLGQVDVGLFVATLKTSQGQTRVLEYVIPGLRESVVLVYGCQADRFTRYRPVFEASAMATTGAYGHRWTETIDWWRILLYASAAIVGTLIAGMKRRKKLAASTAATALPTTWECPQCKRHVPMRIPECRCGMPRPPAA